MSLLEEELHARDLLYKPSARQPQIVDVPALAFLMVDGRGDPNVSQDYRDAVEALYTLSYTLKFALKRAEGINYAVAPLEGLWWGDTMDEFRTGRRADWRWTMMIAQPSPVTSTWVERACVEAARKKALPALPRLRFETFQEGLAAQIMHIGPYATEEPTIQRLHHFIQAQGGLFDGLQQKHHEIYLGNPNRTAPERLKTVIRQPFRRA